MKADVGDDERGDVADRGDDPMTSAIDANDVADAVQRFFNEHEVASLKLPAGWFGRPYDNQHQLTTVATDGDAVVIRLDEVQVLRLHALTSPIDGRTLQIAIRDGYWKWTSYGGTDTHHEQLAAGSVEFHAPAGR